MESGYHCKECGMAVIEDKGQFIRPCGHTGTIVAGMSATAKGISSIKQSTGVSIDKGNTGASR